MWTAQILTWNLPPIRGSQPLPRSWLRKRRTRRDRTKVKVRQPSETKTKWFFLGFLFFFSYFKLLDTTKRPNSRPGQGKATLRGQTIFFFQYRDFSLISNIKSFTGTKYIWTTSCRNWKACVFFFLLQIPPSLKKRKEKEIPTKQEKKLLYE